MTQAAFSFIGTEIVAIAAGEAKNPRRNLPKAIRRVYVRILLFYIGGKSLPHMIALTMLMLFKELSSLDFWSLTPIQG